MHRTRPFWRATDKKCILVGYVQIDRSHCLPSVLHRFDDQAMNEISLSLKTLPARSSLRKLPLS